MKGKLITRNLALLRRWAKAHKSWMCPDAQYRKHLTGKYTDIYLLHQEN